MKLDIVDSSIRPKNSAVFSNSEREGDIRNREREFVCLCVCVSEREGKEIKEENSSN